MFTIDPDPKFIEDVRVDTPDGKGWVTQMLRTEFRVLPLDEVTILDEGGGGLAAVLERAVIGFYDLADASGATLDGFGEWRGKLLQMPNVRMALLRGYSAAVVRVSLGNSASSVAAGPPVH